MNGRVCDLNGLRCIVMGGGGFIGSNLCQALARRGARVQAFGRSMKISSACKDVTWTSGLFEDQSAVAQAIEGNSVLFHLIGAGLPVSSNRDPCADLSGSTINTLKMLDICRESGVKRVIFASSGGTVYGIPKSVPVCEDHPTEPICAYGISKLAIEKYLALYKHLHGLDYVVLRIANPFGRFQKLARKQGVVAAMIASVLRGEPLEFWGTGSVVRDFVHVDDVVEAMIASIFYEGNIRVFNVGSGVGRSINDVAADVERLILAPQTARRVYRDARPADVPINILDIGLIEREMHWFPQVDWQEGLKDTVDWLQNYIASQ